MGKMVRAVFEKKSKNPSKMDVSVLYGKNGLWSLLSHYQCLTSCKVSLVKVSFFTGMRVVEGKKEEIISKRLKSA